MDNWFRDVEMVEDLADYGVSVLGTLKKKKKLEVPSAFNSLTDIEGHTKCFWISGKHDSCVLHAQAEEKCYFDIIYD